jgi:hypothetical protein
MDQDRRLEMSPESTRRWTGFMVVAAALIVLALGFSIGRRFFGPAEAGGDKNDPLTEIPNTLFRGWPKPDLAILLSGQTLGYLQPCGCSEPQYGGLVRRYNLVKLLEKKGWTVEGIELGEIYPNPKYLSDQARIFLPEQARDKFRTTLRALELANYRDFGLGLTEMQMPLLSALTDFNQLNLKNLKPLSLDLKDPEQLLWEKFKVRSDHVVGTQVKVGVSSMIAPSVAKELVGIPLVDFFPNNAMIKVLLPAFAKQKVDAAILLVHGTEQEAEEVARLCFAERAKNPALPKINLIVHTSFADIGPSQPQEVKDQQGKDTGIRRLYMGHKGKEVGVLGVYRRPGGGTNDLKYELVHMGPEFNTPEAQVKDHKMMELMEEYSQSVKNNDYLGAYKALRTRHESQKNPNLLGMGFDAKYVGSKRCGDCHTKAYEVWKNTPHAKAFDELVTAKNPGLRQFDPECVTCHTVGFKHPTGYYDPPTGANPVQIANFNEKLLHVGCESCHGPGSFHANAPNNKNFLPIINPIKLKDAQGNPDPTAMVLLDRFCQQCHDSENDVHWGRGANKKPVEKSWAKISHPGID